MGASKKKGDNGDDDYDHDEEWMKTLLFITKCLVNLKNGE